MTTMVTMKEMKRMIVKEFKNTYGFAPTQKSIRPLETSGAGELIDWMGFDINGIGYSYGVYGTVERNDAYDMI